MAAKTRWKILSKAIKEKSVADDLSTKRTFQSYNLLKITKTTDDDIGQWYNVSIPIPKSNLQESDNEIRSKDEVAIRLQKPRVSISQLTGFNNTGNVCIWPSEECLALYLAQNVQACSESGRVLELGGGQTCLAGLFHAAIHPNSQVWLTDGNQESVENLTEICTKNQGLSIKAAMYRWTQSKDDNKAQTPATCDKQDDHPKTGHSDLLTNGHDDVSTKSDLSINRHNDNSLTIDDANLNSDSVDLLKSGDKSDLNDLDRQEEFDLILCADCLFFDDGRKDLVAAIYKLLKRGGRGLVMAPERNGTFTKFHNLAKDYFKIDVNENYCAEVSALHMKMVSNRDEYPTYEPDIHYPKLIILTKVDSSQL